MPRISNKLVCGVGVKGQGIAKINGKNTKAYDTWMSMLRRCYSQKALSRNPTYVGCSVCDAWLFFPTFNAWFDENYVEGWQLDKDLLVAGNKKYCPEACIFTPPAINTLFTDSGKSRGKYPIGVYFNKRAGKFHAQLRIDGTQKYLGLFNTAEDASQAYQLAKRENIIRMANIWRDKIPTKLYDALLAKAENKL